MVLDPSPPPLIGGFHKTLVTFREADYADFELASKMRLQTPSEVAYTFSKAQSVYYTVHLLVSSHLEA